MSEYQFRHDRAGFTGPLRVHIESTGTYGAAGADGLGQGSGFDDGIINLAGLLKMPDGSDYMAAGAVPGAGFVPAEHRLTVYRGATAISSLSFVPIETAPGVVDINTLLSQGKAVAATPAQLLSLAAAAAELEAQNETFGVTLTAIQAALADTAQSADDARAAAGITRYATLAERDAGLGARSNGDYGAVYLPSGVVFYRVVAGAWVAADSPALASVDYVGGVSPEAAALPSVDYGQFAPGQMLGAQRYELLTRPAGLPLPALGGSLVEPWQFELDLLPWLMAREWGAGEVFLQVQVHAFCTDTYPLRVNFLNTIFNQGLAVDIGTQASDVTAGAGSYLMKRSRRVLLSEATAIGRKGWTRLRVQISAPNGAVELFRLSLFVGWQR